MDSIDADLLMKLQYDFPISLAPFEKLGETVGLDEDEVIRRVKGYMEEGVVLRLGLQLNYRSSDESKAALVALRVRNDIIGEVASAINHTRGVKHNYLRNCEEFNIWFTVKAVSPEDLNERIVPILKLPGVEDSAVLPTKRVYKINIKYDLRRGISWSDPAVEPERIPTVRELGLDPRLSTDLERSFKPERRPFKFVADKYALPEERLIVITNELTRLGVARGFGAVLSSEKVGFGENAMVVFKVGGDIGDVCERLVRSFPQITHCVERETNRQWNYPAYVMLHARDSAKIFEVFEVVRGVSGVVGARPVFSLANLRKAAT